MPGHPISSPDAAGPLSAHLADWISGAIAAAPPGHVPLLFLSGPQGAGKTTALHSAIGALSQPVFGASIDDFYLPRAAREDLARWVSPLFITRGPPGTHDLERLSQTIAALHRARETSATPIPSFDKLADDRAPQDTVFEGRPAAIIIEGWLMGALPDPGAPGDAPLNEVEAEDRSGAWRAYQEEALAGPYAALWDKADGFFHIQPPDFSCVMNWRTQQEEGLWAARGAAMPEDRRAWLARFIAHYERITRRMIAGGRRPGTDVHIDAQRKLIPPPAPA